MSENTVFSDGNDIDEISSLIGGFGFLNDGAFVQAKGYFDGCLEKDPNNASAHIGALLAELQLKNLDELGATLKSFENSAHFKEAYRLADEKLKQRLDTALHLKNAHQASYRAHTLLANPKRAKDYSEAAYYLAECLRYRKDDKDAVRQLKFCEEKYKALTGNSLALQDDLRPDSDMLFASSRYVR